MSDWMKKENAMFFVGGMVAGVAGLKFMKTEKARKYAVQGLAKGMLAKDCVMEEVTNLRDEADDICREARELAKAQSETEVVTEEETEA